MNEPIIVTAWLGITIFLGLFLMIITPVLSINLVGFSWGFYSINGICIGLYGYITEYEFKEKTK